MTSTSATGGYLLPVDAPAPLYDDPFEDFLQAVVVGVTGLDPKMVRPRWQPEPPNMPQSNADWCAIGVKSFDPDTYAVQAVQNDGSYAMTRYETDEVLASFYGPNAQANMAVLRDGLQIDQNRAALDAAGVKLQKTGEPTNVPSLVKEKWQKRVDLPIIFRREIKREYRVFYLLSAQCVVESGGESLITDDIEVTQ